MRTPVPSTVFHNGLVISKDGTPIGYRQAGTGPGLVILHGGLRAAHHYERLAAALADAYTITIPDRRGRGWSGPPGGQYSLEKECDDLAAILRQTRAQILFGHSGGGLFALEAALELPLSHLILYEPAVSINGSLPTAWVWELEKALERNDFPGAMTSVCKGLPLNWMSKLPAWALRALFALMLQGTQGEEIKGLLRTGVHEGKVVRQLDSSHERYRGIQAETLLLGGAKSPPFLLDPLQRLEKILPRASRRLLPGLEHTAPDEDAPERVALAVREFLQPGERVR